MQSRWRLKARAMIAQLHEAMPTDIDLKNRRAWLRRHGWCVHRGTSHGKKIWAQEARAYLEQHGLPPLRPRAALPLLEALLPLLDPSDPAGEGE